MLLETFRVIDPDCHNGYRIINAIDMCDDDVLYTAKRAPRKMKTDDLPDASAADDTQE